jgi:subtilisin family serine protease
MFLRASVAFCALAVAGCASGAVKPSIDPGRLPPVESPADRLPTPEIRPYSQSPRLAFQLQKMPLYTTGVPQFLAQHPEADGRGVLIAILDSGIDAGIPGLASTTTGDRKILDLRDFSGEGRIPLAPVKPVRDSVTVGRITLAGFGRVVLFSGDGPWYGGTLREQSLGKGPSADIDANGYVGDDLAVIVARASDGWIMLADTDRNGSLLGEKPIRDYLSGRETFGWARKGVIPRVNLAANFSDSAGRPVLDLFFDTSGHGSHVAGIAAGHNIYDVTGFDGVAPGAQLLGLKIANNAQGGLSTSGSMIRAMDYAIRFAARRRLPLVLNMSFAVGNEIEGQARIDQLIDSVLSQRPDLVFVVSAGNDGPGLSTMGFPGSASRALTVGAVLPGDPSQDAGVRDEPIAYFSARGGEVAKPEVVTPGVAFSTVPLWDRGEEVKSGTSMAAPHAAGLVALLYSALKQEEKAVPSARTIRQALMVTARPVPGASFPDQGAGIPALSAAYRWLATGRVAPEIDVRAEHGVTASLHPAGLSGQADSIQRFTLVRPAGLPPATYTLRSNSSWLIAPPTVTLADTTTTLTLRYRPEVAAKLGTTTAVASGWPADTMAGPAFRLVNTVAQSVPGDSGIRESAAVPIPSGGERRLFIVADSGRPFEASVRIGGRFPLLVFLHEPNGMALRGSQPQIAGTGQDEVSFKLDGRDVTGGPYELVAVAPPTEPSSARFEVRRAPLTFDARREGAGVLARISSDSTAADRRVRMSLVGAERRVMVEGRGGDTATTEFEVPGWATRLVVDLTMSREQWSRFTDFGMTLYDSIGIQVDNAPLNYSFGRIESSFDAGHRGQAMAVRLFPALAEPASNESWRATLSIRLYAEDDVLLSAAQGGASAPIDEETTLFTLPPSPWILGNEFFLLGLMKVTEQGEAWTREVPLPEPSTPLTR